MAFGKTARAFASDGAPSGRLIPATPQRVRSRLVELTGDRATRHASADEIPRSRRASALLAEKGAAQTSSDF